ncbi:unnamed protein product [Phytophthora fragariaefolia]|uniref:Unnamed protein product n=1 Tax=Phytophthora fragariaefolia TaxID=1490495 RepID=A0A9W7D5H9_9STRA|nr:unnamed protein product [Phytophthora fragariaefolia]
MNSRFASHSALDHFASALSPRMISPEDTRPQSNALALNEPQRDTSDPRPSNGELSTRLDLSFRGYHPLSRDSPNETTLSQQQTPAVQSSPVNRDNTTLPRSHHGSDNPSVGVEGDRSKTISSGDDSFSRRKGDTSSIASTSTKQNPDSKQHSPGTENSGLGDKVIKLEAMSIETMNAAAQDGQQYVRGDPSTAGLTVHDGSSNFDDGAGDSPLVIGGRKRGWQTEAQSGLYAASSRFQNGLRFSVCAAALISVLLLLIFHFEVLSKGLDRYLPSGSVWAPNSWEFLLYAQYIQQIGVISALTLLESPYFLWDFSDLFSWSNFLVYHAPDEYYLKERRLRTVILGGLVGYADRIGTNEMKLLTSTCAGFAVVISFFLGVVLGSSLWGKWREPHSNIGRKGIAWRCLGLVFLIWFFSLLPLSMAVSFEVSMELKAQALELWPLSIGFVVVVIVIFGFIVVVTRAILHRGERDLSKLRPRALWGAFYSDYTYAGRLFFLLMIALQICIGLCLGLLTDSELILGLMIGLHVIFFVAMFILKPFADCSSRAKYATYAVTVLKVTNLALLFAFLPASPLSVSGLNRAANALIGLNSLVILAWCLRHLVMFIKLAVASAKHEVETRITQNSEIDVGAPPFLALSEFATKPPVNCPDRAGTLRRNDPALERIHNFC